MPRLGGLTVILHSNTTKPLYIQIAEWLENEILSGNIRPHERIYSQYQLAEMFNINPATAAKGLSLLLEENLVYKKRGLGMFVAEEAQARIQVKRESSSSSTAVSSWRHFRLLLSSLDQMFLNQIAVLVEPTSSSKRKKQQWLFSKRSMPSNCRH